MGNVFAYTRVSTVKQGEKGVSLGEQKDAILRYAGQHDLTITRWFEERESAAKKGRPAFTEMLRLLRLGVARGVIIHKIDRSARNLEDWADIGRLADTGVAVHFANEGVDLATVSGRLSADIQAVVAAHYSRNLREEAKKGIYGRLKQGFYPFRAPLGYLNRGAAKPKEIDPVAGPLVRKAFELYDSGKYPLKALAAHLHEQGLRNLSGGAVAFGAIAKMLNNPFYFGVIRIKKTGQNFSGNHAPLVSPELFDRVQARLRGKTVDRVTRHEFLFSRLVQCGSCGYSLIGEQVKGYTYYRCHNRPFKSPPVCPKTIVKEEQLEAAVQNLLQTITLSDKEIAYLVEWIAEQRAQLKRARKDEKNAATMQLETVHLRLSRLMDLLLDGGLNKPIFDQKQGELLRNEAQLKQKLAVLEEESDISLKEIERTVELAKDALSLYRTADIAKKRELLRHLLSNCTVSSGKIDLALKIPFRFIAELTNSSCGGPYRGTCRTLEQALTQLYKHILQAGPVIPS